MEDLKNKNYVAFMSIDYEDGDASTFNGIEISYGSKNKNFNSGDPLIDWYDYCKFIYEGSALDDGIGSIAHSSSVDHWFMDTDEYVEKFLKFVEEKHHYEFMTKDELSKLTLSDMKGKLRCVIHKDMKSFQELKNYYKTNKK